MLDADRPDYSNTPVSARRARFGYVPADSREPCVSIVTPFFNTGAVFAETVQSVLHQSMQQWEWLIVNDGSDDVASLEILDRVRNSDPRIRIIDLPARSGPGAARNVGNSVARTGYVLQLDSDNLIEPTALEKWLWHLHCEPGCGFVNASTVSFGAFSRIGTGQFSQRREFLRRNWVDGTALVRRRVLEDVGGYDDTIRDGMEDWEFWLRCASAGHWGHSLPEPLIWYRWREHHTSQWADWDEGERQHRFRERLRERYPALWKGEFPDVVKPVPSPDAAMNEEFPGHNVLSKDKRRLLLIVPWYAVGGADQFNVSLLSQLIRRGWEVTVASTAAGDDPWMSRFTALTPDVFSLPRFLAPADYPRFLAYLVGSRQADAVMVSHSEFGYQVLPYLRSKYPNVSFVDYLHNVEPTWRNGGYPALSLESHNHLDFTAVSSHSLRSWMVERGAAADRVEVCHINVDPDSALPDENTRARIRNERGASENIPVILFAGRVCSQKQPLVLVDTLKRLHRMVPGFQAWIAGDGPDMPVLRKALERSGLEANVQLLGELRHEEVLELMTAADVFFLPSKYEGIASTLYEAMASGLPVVSVDSGGQRELVSEDCGVLISSTDAQTEATAYATILADLLRTPEKRIAMGSAARSRIVSEFGVERMGNRLIGVLDRAQEVRRVTPPATFDQVQILQLTKAAIERAIQQDRELRMQGANAGQPLNVKMHATLSRWFVPVHDVAVRKGWTWVPRAGLHARRLLLGKGNVL